MGPLNRLIQEPITNITSRAITIVLPAGLSFLKALQNSKVAADGLLLILPLKAQLPIWEIIHTEWFVQKRAAHAAIRILDMYLTMAQQLLLEGDTALILYVSNFVQYVESYAG